MIRRTRLKFFVVMASIVLMIVSTFCGGILISTHLRNQSATQAVLNRMLDDAESGRAPYGKPLPDDSPSRFNQMRGFTVLTDESFAILQLSESHAFFSDEEVIQVVAEIANDAKASGLVGSVQYQVRTIETGKLIAVLDIGMETSMFSELLATVLLAGGSGTIALLCVIWLLSFWVIRPVAVALEKQKRFISEAGHELKTPLTVISAGIELLQRDEDASQRERWLTDIGQQAEKMNLLTAELLTLSRLDEQTNKPQMTEFDLSQAVLAEVLAFESIAYEQQKTWTHDIECGIVCKNNLQAVRQAVGILCDNALKHSEPLDTVSVRLVRQNNRPILTATNSTELRVEDLPLLFERFYRGSHSRANSSGAGLGLAILKTLAEQNGWKLDATIERGRITFSILF